MPTLTLYPSGYINTQSYSTSNISNAYRASATTGDYANINLTQGSGGQTTFYYTFDTSDLPANVNITEVSCQTGILISNTNTNRISSKSVQLCSGTTKKGSANTNITTTVGTKTIDCGDWTVQELKDCRLGLFATRGSRYTTTNYYFRIYGATLTITYEFIPAEITISSSGQGTYSPTAFSDIYLGDDVTLTFSPLSGKKLLSVIDNDVDVTHDYSITDDEFTITNSTSTASYCFTKSSTLTYTSTISGSSTVVSTTRFTTNFSSEITLTLAVTPTTNSSDRLYIGNIDTALSTTTTRPSTGQYIQRVSGGSSTTNVTVTVPAGTHFFELYNYHYRTNSSRTMTVVFSGMHPGVVQDDGSSSSYTYSLLEMSENHNIVIEFTPVIVMRKINGDWTRQYTKIWKKINNEWVQLTDLEILDLFDVNTHYKKGN